MYPGGRSGRGGPVERSGSFGGGTSSLLKESEDGGQRGGGGFVGVGVGVGLSLTFDPSRKLSKLYKWLCTISQPPYPPPTMATTRSTAKWNHANPTIIRYQSPSCLTACNGGARMKVCMTVGTNRYSNAQLSSGYTRGRF